MIFTIFRYLKFVSFNVLPEWVNNGAPGSCVDPEEPGQSEVEFELSRFVIQHKHHRTFHITVAWNRLLTPRLIPKVRISDKLTTWSFDLKTIGFLSICLSVPFDQMVIGTIKFFVQLNYKRFEKCWKFSFCLARSCFGIFVAEVE